MSVAPPLIDLDEETYSELLSHIDPLCPCPDFGVQLYIDCVNFLQLRV